VRGLAGGPVTAIRPALRRSGAAVNYRRLQPHHSTKELS
jgi:hypothetical protein